LGEAEKRDWMDHVGVYSAIIKIRLMETVVVSISRFFNYSF